MISTGKGESFGKIKAMQPNLTQRMGGKAKKSKTSGEDKDRGVLQIKKKTNLANI